jgi:radical SAM protein with 4Fe4S-binding SPASM domain
MNDSVYPVTSGHLVIKKRGDFNLVKDVKTGVKGRANDDSRALLLLCDGTRTVQDIVEEVAAEYEESQKDIEKKVKKSLEFLEDLQFLSTVEEPVYTPLIVRDTDMEWPLDIVYLEVTNACNLQCVHCYKDAGKALPAELTTKDWITIIDELTALGVLSLAVTGGEPLLREDIFDILHHAHKNALSIALFTNGTLITDHVITALTPLHIERVVVSLDGTKETHEKIRGKNTFDKTVESIKQLIQNGFKVRSNTVIYTQNITEIDHVIKMLLDWGVYEMIFDRYMDTGRGKKTSLAPPLEMGAAVAEQCKQSEEKAPQRFELTFTSTMGEPDDYYSFCGIGTSMCAITANGNVVLCPVLSTPQYTAGNVNDTPLKELWLTHDVFQPFRECTLDDTVCGSCPHKSTCRGGCKARALQMYKKVCMPDPWMCSTRGQQWPPV